jgi:dethiobiotin synthetase
MSDRPDAVGPTGVVVVTGTGTSVGKSVVTAAVAALARAAGRTVAVVKPAQTGAGSDEPGDVGDVVRLAGLPDDAGHEGVRYVLPLAPAGAARLEGREPPDLAATVQRVRDLAASHDLVLVEGAGGLLVPFDDEGRTLADLARDVGDCAVVVVSPPGLGSLNATALTVEALDRRGLRLLGVVVGRWPAEPDLACRANLDDLEALLGGPLAGVLADGIGELGPEAFLAAVSGQLGPPLGGGFDAADFRRTHAARPEG